MDYKDIKWNRLLHKSFKQFDASELCFLALTSKPEAVLRNKVAWTFYQNQGEYLTKDHNECLVGRECSRIDMAIFDSSSDSDEPLLGIEFKTATAANMLHYSFKDDHIQDFHKDLNKGVPLVTIFYEALDSIDTGYSNVIKYHGRHNKIEDHAMTNYELQKILKKHFNNVSVLNPYIGRDFLGIGVRFHPFILSTR